MPPCHSQIKRNLVLKNIMKMENNDKLKEINIKNRTCHYFDNIIKFKDIDFDNISIDEKSNENILFYNISYKTLIGAKLLHIRFDKIDGFIRYFVLDIIQKLDIVLELDILSYLELKNMIPFTTGLVILQE